MLKNNPGARFAVYAALFIVAALNLFKIIDSGQALQAVDLINKVSSLLGLGGAALAMTNVLRQKTDGTLDIPGGTPAEQLAIAARNYAKSQAAEAAALQQAIQQVPGPVADAIRAATQLAPSPAPVPEYAPTTYQPATLVAGFMAPSDPAVVAYNGQVVTCGDAPR